MVVGASDLTVGVASLVQVLKTDRQGLHSHAARKRYVQRSPSSHDECVGIILFAALLLMTGAGYGAAGRAASTVAVFHTSDSEGPTFDPSWMPDFVDLVPDYRPANLTLELVVGVEDPDGVDSVIGSYRNSSRPEWTNVTMSEDLTRSSSGVYTVAALRYTTPWGSFLTVWQVIFYANDSLGNWNISVMKNMSICRQSGQTRFIVIDAGPAAVSVVIVGVMTGTVFCYLRSKDESTTRI